MSEKNLIHLKFEYQEALNGKKDILSSEKTLINLLRIMKSYSELRENEMKLKTKLHRKIKETQGKMKKLQNELPHLKSLEQSSETETEEPVAKKQRKSEPEIKGRRESSIEAQINDIQKKLNAIHQG